MKHIFNISSGLVSIIPNPKGKESIEVYITNSALRYNDAGSIANIILQFKKHNHHEKFIRGKYLLWFLVEFCLSIYQECMSLSLVSIPKKPKMTTILSQANAIIMTAPRSRVPGDLKLFFSNTITKYVDSKMAA